MTSMPVLAMTKGQARGQAKVPLAWVEQIAARFGPPGSDPATQAEMVNVMLAKLGNDTMIMSPGEFSRLVRKELDDYARIVKAAGIKPQ